MATIASNLLERPLRLLLADDHTLFRHSLQEVLQEEPDMRVVAEAADGVEAVWRARALWPHQLDLVLMDVDMPRLDGISALRRIVAEHPDVPVVMLTVSMLDRDVLGAARAGAVGYLSKGLAPAAIVRALRDYHREGALPMARTTAARVLAHLQEATRAADQPTMPRSTTPAEVESLTDREREVLHLLAEGRSNKEVATLLDVGVSTVETHRANLMQKLNLHNTADIVLYAVRKGIIQP
jgi:DNA-binding NarL/FixJ family response regulator